MDDTTKAVQPQTDKQEAATSDSSAVEVTPPPVDGQPDDDGERGQFHTVRRSEHPCVDCGTPTTEIVESVDDDFAMCQSCQEKRVYPDKTHEQIDALEGRTMVGKAHDYGEATPNNSSDVA